MSPQEATHRNRILVITSDVLGHKMAGPGIRAWEIAKAVSPVADVRLVSNESADIPSASFPVLAVTDTSLRDHVAWADVVVFHGGILSTHRWIIDTDVIVVADVYDPIHLEALELGKDFSESDRAGLIYSCEEALNTQLERADYILCASEKQRDFWLGHLGALGRIGSSNYDRDNSVRALIDVAPFGVSELAPQQTRHGIKGVVPGINPNDKVIIWGGGIYNWFDPITLIHAMKELADSQPSVKLFFLGVTHPNPNVPTMRMATETMSLAEELGLLGKNVFFNTGWVEYDDRINYLKDADLGISTHFEHIETAFSFRTRILDYLWAGLPIVSTDGDTFAPIIRERHLGKVVAPESADELVSAITEILFEQDAEILSNNVSQFAEEMTWSKALHALVEFCRNPSHAADYRDSTLINTEQALRSQLDTMSNHIKALEAAQREIHQSTSWRITAPLRTFRRNK